MVTVHCEFANAAYFGKQSAPEMGRKVKACIPCHERKVRCDAAIVGIPCSRCAGNSRTHICVMLQALDENKARPKRKRANEGMEADTVVQPSECLLPLQMSGPERIIEANRNMPSTSATIAPMPHTTAIDRGPHIVVDSISPTSLPQNPSSFLPFQFGEPLNNAQGRPVESDLNSHAGPGILQFIHEQPYSTGSQSPDDYENLIEFHDGTNSITILNEALDSVTPKKQIQKGNGVSNRCKEWQSGISSVNDIDADYLRRKGALVLPSKEGCDKMLRLFFECVFVCVPILDRIKFVQEYRRQTCSMFLLQAILASAVPHASAELLGEIGFQSHSIAQETLVFRAKLLYDFEVEKGQLRLLQGCLILSITHISHSMQKDYRYWLSNAACLATKLGLHRDILVQRLDLSTQKVVRRIWWVLYTWDALLALNGMDNMRRFHANDFDTSHLIEADWDEQIPTALRGFLQPFTTFDKSYLIYSCKLSLIIGKFWQRFPARSPEASFSELQTAIMSWRNSLPPHLKSANPNEPPTTAESWSLILIARSHVCECIMYRMIRRSQSADKSLINRASEMLHRAMFELDTTVDRIMNRRNGHFNTWFLHTCISTALALHVERILGFATSSFDRVLSSLRIQGNLEFLRDMSKTWPYIGALVKMFEGVMRSSGLSVPVPADQSGPNDAISSQHPSYDLRLRDDLVDVGNGAGHLNFEVDDILSDFQTGPFDANSILEEIFSESSQLPNPPNVFN